MAGTIICGECMRPLADGEWCGCRFSVSITRDDLGHLLDMARMMTVAKQTPTNEQAAAFDRAAELLREHDRTMTGRTS